MRPHHCLDAVNVPGLLIVLELLLDVLASLITLTLLGKLVIVGSEGNGMVNNKTLAIACLEGNGALNIKTVFKLINMVLATE